MSNQLDIFGMSGADRRDEALNKLDKAHSEWIDLALDAVDKLSCQHNEFTTDAVWAVVGDPPKEPRAMGAVMQRAAKNGWIERTNRTINSTRPECHARPLRVWRSTIQRALTI